MLLVFLCAFSIGQSLIEDKQLCNESKDELIIQRWPKLIELTSLYFQCQTIFGVCLKFVDKTFPFSVPPESTLST